MEERTPHSGSSRRGLERRTSEEGLGEASAAGTREGGIREDSAGRAREVSAGPGRELAIREGFAGGYREGLREGLRESFRGVMGRASGDSWSRPDGLANPPGIPRSRLPRQGSGFSSQGSWLDTESTGTGTTAPGTLGQRRTSSEIEREAGLAAFKGFENDLAWPQAPRVSGESARELALDTAGGPGHRIARTESVESTGEPGGWHPSVFMKWEQGRKPGGHLSRQASSTVGSETEDEFHSVDEEDATWRLEVDAVIEEDVADVSGFANALERDARENDKGAFGSAILDRVQQGDGGYDEVRALLCKSSSEKSFESDTAGKEGGGKGERGGSREELLESSERRSAEKEEGPERKEAPLAAAEMSAEGDAVSVEGLGHRGPGQEQVVRMAGGSRGKLVASSSGTEKVPSKPSQPVERPSLLTSSGRDSSSDASTPSAVPLADVTSSSASRHVASGWTPAVPTISEMHRLSGDDLRNVEPVARSAVESAVASAPLAEGFGSWDMDSVQPSASAVAAQVAEVQNEAANREGEVSRSADTAGPFLERTPSSILKEMGKEKEFRGARKTDTVSAVGAVGGSGSVDRSTLPDEVRRKQDHGLSREKSPGQGVQEPVTKTGVGPPVAGAPSEASAKAALSGKLSGAEFKSSAEQPKKRGPSAGAQPEPPPLDLSAIKAAAKTEEPVLFAEAAGTQGKQHSESGCSESTISPGRMKGSGPSGMSGAREDSLRPAAPLGVGGGVSQASGRSGVAGKTEAPKEAGSPRGNSEVLGTLDWNIPWDEVTVVSVSVALLVVGLSPRMNVFVMSGNSARSVPFSRVFQACSLGVRGISRGTRKFLHL